MTRFGHVMIAGRPNAGKSSLLNALVGEPLALVSPKAQATRVPVVGLRTDGDVQIAFHDLPGLLDPAYPLQARMRDLAQEALGRADLIVYLQTADAWPPEPLTVAAGLAAPPRAPILPIMSKVDLLAPSARPEPDDPSILAVSATTGQGLDRLVAAIADRLPEAPFEYPEDDLGAQPLRFFVTEYLREAAFALLEDELPYAVAAEVEEFREDADPVYIRATLYVERESQKRIVVGTGGRTIKAIGQHARERIEHLLGRRVFLETWIKVLPRWRKSADLLARLGFPEAHSGEGR